MSLAPAAGPQFRFVEEITLFTRSETPFMSPARKYDWGAGLSEIDISRLDAQPDVLARLRCARGLYARLEAGDALYIPKNPRVPAAHDEAGRRRCSMQESGSMHKAWRSAVPVALVILAGPAQAQGYPARAIRFVIPTAPGGGPDVVARMIAPRLSELLGQQVVVENRAGANAMIGAEVVARAPADGYTWLFGTGQNTVNHSLMRKVPHDIVEDFAPVSLVYQSAFIQVVHPNVPARSVKEFIAFARAQPDRLNFGSGGIGSAAHLSGELFMMSTGVRMVHVPYKGAGLALADLLGGQLDLMYPAIASAHPYVRAGRLRPLGVTSPRRHPSLPEVPAIAETVAGYEARSWIGVLVPAKTPRDIVSRIHGAVVKIVNLPDVRHALIEQGTDPETNTPEEFARYIREEVLRAARVVKAAGIKPE